MEGEAADEEKQEGPAPPPRIYKWDVFISFRGEDTRENFTIPLYEELVRNNIRAFLDDEGLNTGEEISDNLLTAIEESAASIVVISRRYASSRWCLKELFHILESRRFIIPVFYQVDPSDVQLQKAPFKKDFCNQEKRFGKDEVLKWRKAMEKAGRLQGFESLYRYELRGDEEEKITYDKLAQSLAPEISGHEDVKKALRVLLVGASHQKLKVAMKVLVDMGICAIDEYNKMEESNQTSIHKVKELEAVSLAKDGITISLNATNAVLVAANPVRDSQLIQDLVKKILIKVNNTPLGIAKHPIGINPRVGDLMKVLNVKSNDVQVVGFHGKGGIGKTTLAKAVYNRIVAQFEHHSFISNIRETSRKHNGLVSLQNQLIHHLFKIPDNVFLIDEVNRGIIDIKKRIYEKRVLIVLDDVDDVGQLDALAGGRDWFYKGSRIIITTRNQDVLREHLVNEIYEVKELDFPESVQLFSYHAFGKEKPTEPFVHLTKKIVTLTGQLPLALEVFGALLFYEKGIKEWENMLGRLKQIQPGNLQDVLKISYDRLNKEEKGIFLDIAYFFTTMRMTRESAIDILKGCGFNAETAIKELMTKSLIKIIDDNTLWMHDELVDMGRQIVQQERDRGEPSRLWNHDEIKTVLSSGKGAGAVEGIMLDFEERQRKEISSAEELANNRIWSTLKEKLKNCFDFEAKKDKEVTLYTKQLEQMLNLRLLQINHVNLEGDFKCIPDNLRWLQWKGCPLKSLPSDFCPEKLAVLDLSESMIKQVWDQGWLGAWYKMAKELKELKELNLHGCQNLTATPYFSGNPNLEKLILERCQQLVVIHESIGDLRELRVLNLRDCLKLEEFPKDISGLRNLETLVLSGCSKLKELPEELSCMKPLTELLVDETAIMKLPESIFRLKKLKRLSLKGCLSLKQLPEKLGRLAALRELFLDGSSALSEIPNSIGSLTNLETLSLKQCKSITAIPDSIGSLTNLETLSLKQCESITTIPDSIGNLESLSELFLDATKIKELPDSIGSLSHLKHLSVSCCRSLSKLPVSIGRLPSTVKLQLEGTSITELPDRLEL